MGRCLAWGSWGALGRRPHHRLARSPHGPRSARQLGHNVRVNWLAMLGTAVVSSALTWVTSTLAARRAAADARAHWEQGKMLRASSERLLAAADAYSQLAYLHVESIMGGPTTPAGRSSPYRPDEAFTRAHDELSSAMRALRLDAPDELQPVLDKIERRTSLLRIAYTDVPPTRQDFRLIAESWPHDTLPMSCNVLPEVSQLVSEFTRAARVSLGHTSRQRGRRPPFRRPRRRMPRQVSRPASGGTRSGP